MCQIQIRPQVQLKQKVSVRRNICEVICYSMSDVIILDSMSSVTAYYSILSPIHHADVSLEDFSKTDLYTCRNRPLDTRLKKSYYCSRQYIFKCSS